VVAIANRLSDAFPFVGIDDRAAMYDAVMYAVSRGYRRIVYVSPPPARLDKTNLYAQERRMRGCVDALERCGRGVESWIVDTAEYIKKLNLIELGKGPRTAFLCSSDLYALEVLNYLRARGARMPDEAGLMGFDNIDVLKYVRASLATVAYPVEKLGTRSVDLLLQLIHGRTDWSDAVLDHRIVEGETM
jgi:LacI family transcriptional regulator